MKSKLYNFLIAFFAATFLFSGTVVVGYKIHSAKQEAAYEELVQKVENTTEEKEDTPQLIPYDDDEFFIPEYYDLYCENNDLSGWIKIADTQMNYPVMQTIDRPDYYLRRGFDQKYAYHGVPYVQENCNLVTGYTSDNIIMHGHNMDDGSMFGTLEKYMHKSFYDEHPIINFDTLTQRGEYQVMSVFMVSVDPRDSTFFEYYSFTDAETPQQFTEFVNNCKRRQLYDTGISAEYGDKLLTLSTCEYSRENGRLVVVAKKI